ncbi:MAG: hypothetical protein CVU56_01625 [Deltaproteobacteria bacterium HGW-Deltaproteobacteria-14]|nr:MAG: hypothetical protein CVU56_01625 [Deltaproteobacteria bacterium HGW-Deltaproteobacteria-14]
MDTVLDALDARAAATPERLAFVVGVETVTFGALATDSRRLAGRLGTLGVRPGDRVALLLGSSAGFLRALFALQRLRATPVAVHAGLPAEAVGRRVALIRAALALVPEGWADAPAGPAPRLGWRPLSALPEGELAVTTRPGPEDVAYLQLTSGTTAASKAAVVSHRSLAASLAASVSFLEADADDVFVSWMPLHHDLGLVRFGPRRWCWSSRRRPTSRRALRTGRRWRRRSPARCAPRWASPRGRCASPHRGPSR